MKCNDTSKRKVSPHNYTFVQETPKCTLVFKNLCRASEEELLDVVCTLIVGGVLRVVHLRVVYDEMEVVQKHARIRVVLPSQPLLHHRQVYVSAASTRATHGSLHVLEVVGHVGDGHRIAERPAIAVLPHLAQ